VASVSHPAAGAGGPGAAGAGHPGGTRTARGWWHPRCNVSMSLLMVLAVPPASWPCQGAAPCTRRSCSSSCCPGGGKHGDVSEGSKKQRGETQPEAEGAAGVRRCLAASPTPGRNKMSQQHLHRFAAWRGKACCSATGTLCRGAPVQLPASGPWEAAPRALGTGLLGKSVPPEPEHGPRRDGGRGDGGSRLALLHPRAAAPRDPPIRAVRSSRGGPGPAGRCGRLPWSPLAAAHLHGELPKMPSAAPGVALPGESGLCSPCRHLPMPRGTAVPAACCAGGHPLCQGILG